MEYNRAAMPIPNNGDTNLGGNLFETAKITSDKSILQQIPITKNHPSPPQNLTSEDSDLPLPTNDSTTSLLVKQKGVPNYQQPYIYTITDKNEIGISTTNPQKRVRGDNYIYNPVGVHSLLVTAATNSKQITVKPLLSNNTNDSSKSFAFGSKIEMATDNGNEFLDCPIVQGAGLVSIVMKPSNCKLEINSTIGIRQFQPFSQTNTSNDGLYVIELHDNSTWLMKVLSQRGINNIGFENSIVGVNAQNGCLIQFFPMSIAQELGNQINDSFISSLCFGSFANSFNLFSENGSDSMSFEYDIVNYLNSSNNNAEAMIFLLPHHMNIISQGMNNCKTGVMLWSSVYGVMTGFVTRSIKFDFGNNNEDISKYDIFKSSSLLTENMNLFVDNISIIKKILLKDLEGANIAAETDLNSMYFAGKVFNKYAWLLLISNRILNDDDLSKQIFNDLTNALNRFISNKQQLPLVYDQNWKGLISSGSSGEDFGNSYYNDHHFHYGYFVLTFAILADYDFNWFLNNRSYSDLLLRDYCNIDLNDFSFINYRNFNWFSGHSWANGIWPSLDGKDQESSSEDYNSVYAMYLYGSITNNSEMQKIAKFQLNTMKYSNNCYFLYQRNNTNIFRELLPNKVAGIFFQNKIDYATYFGKNTEYIHLIHFIPGTFISKYIRPKKFIQEEWEEKLQGLNLNDNGWNGLLKLNQSMIDPNTVNFFKDANLNKSNLDNGQSQAFSLILSLIWSQNI